MRCCSREWSRVALVVVGIAGLGATLAAAPRSALDAGSGARVPIRLETGVHETVAAVQFDVIYDAQAFEVAGQGGVEAGPSAEAALKQVTYAVREPGRVRVLVAGLNQNRLEDGVLAVVNVAVRGRAEAGTSRLTLRNVVMSNPSGRRVAAQSEDGVIVMTPAPVDGAGTASSRARDSYWPAVLSGAAALGAAAWLLRRYILKPRRAAARLL